MQPRQRHLVHRIALALARFAGAVQHSRHHMEPRLLLSSGLLCLTVLASTATAAELHAFGSVLRVVPQTELRDAAFEVAAGNMADQGPKRGGGGRGLGGGGSGRRCGGWRRPNLAALPVSHVTP